MKLKGICLVCIISLFFQIFVFNIPVFAVEQLIPVPGYSELKEMDDDIKNGDNRTLQDLWNTLQPIGSAIGVVMNPIQTIEFIRDIVDPVAENLPDYPTSGSETEKANFLSSYLIDNTSIDDSNKTYSLNQNAKNLVNGIVNNYINDSGVRIVYSINIQQNLNDVSDGDIYNALRRSINDNSMLNICRLNTTPAQLGIYNTNNVGMVYSGTDSANRYYVTLYDRTNWDPIILTNSHSMFLYDSNTKSFVEGTSSFVANRFEVSSIPDNVAPDINSGLHALSSSESLAFRMYMSLDALKADSVGQAPYYFNQPVYNTWNSSTGDYTVTTDNSNRATYNDIINHNEQIYINTGEYPTYPDIIKWIPTYEPSVEPTPTPEPDKPSGGGSFVNNNNPSITNNPTFNNNPNINITLFPSVSVNGTVSGNGTGNGSGLSGNIFDFIGRLGSILGDLIKNLGNALVDLITGISETISSVLSGLTNIFTGIIEFTFSGLPEDIRGLLLLGLSVGLIVSVVKILRG